MENLVIDIKKRFDLSGHDSLIRQAVEYFGETPLRIQVQLDIFKGFDEIAILLKSGSIFRCLVNDNKQVSDWQEVRNESKGGN